MAAIKGRKDSKGYVLRTGESQRNDGRYCYAYSDRKQSAPLYLCQDSSGASCERKGTSN